MCVVCVGRVEELETAREAGIVKQSYNTFLTLAFSASASLPAFAACRFRVLVVNYT
jgi:hypothetical protein